MTMEVEIGGGDRSEAAAKSRNAKDSWQPPEKLERQRKMFFPRAVRASVALHTL